METEEAGCDAFSGAPVVSNFREEVKVFEGVHVRTDEMCSYFASAL